MRLVPLPQAHGAGNKHEQRQYAQKGVMRRRHQPQLECGAIQHENLERSNREVVQGPRKKDGTQVGHWCASRDKLEC